MSIKNRDIMDFLEEMAPKALAEDWDNVGLLLGSADRDADNVLICLDVTERVVDEAVRKKVHLIISHHPFIFKGMKGINEDDNKGRVIYKLIKNDISVYAAHTNLDVAEGGINEHLCSLLGLKSVENLKEYKSEKLYKLVVFVPEDRTEAVRNAMCVAGAGWIGNYSDCSFITGGTGTFKPRRGTKPYIGTEDKLEHVNECRIETIVPQNKLSTVLDSMIKAHPYEEAAYDIYPLELAGKRYGLGKAGTLEVPCDLNTFIRNVKNVLAMENVRLIGRIDKKIKKAAVFCGSFDEDLSCLARQDIDVLVTGDVKYHTAVDIISAGLCVIDAGHFNTEKIVVPMLVKSLSERFPEISVFGSGVEEEPFKIT